MPADPTTILVALIGGGGMALTATITSFFSYKSSKASKATVKDHITEETLATNVIADNTTAMLASLERHGGALDDILTWQGKHEAAHKRNELARAEAVARAETSEVRAEAHRSSQDKISEASQALVRDIHDRPHTPPVTPTP